MDFEIKQIKEIKQRGLVEQMAADARHILIVNAAVRQAIAAALDQAVPIETAVAIAAAINLRAADAPGRLLAVAQQRRPRREQERQDRRLDVGANSDGSAQHVQHRAVGGAGELGLRQLVVRPDQHAGEQHAHGAVHAAVPVLTKVR